jgi:hypothetical protein
LLPLLLGLALLWEPCLAARTKALKVAPGSPGKPPCAADGRSNLALARNDVSRLLKSVNVSKNCSSDARRRVRRTKKLHSFTVHAPGGACSTWLA